MNNSTSCLSETFFVRNLEISMRRISANLSPFQKKIQILHLLELTRFVVLHFCDLTYFKSECIKYQMV